jgi:DNA-binding CsgD family transcriptional regulator
MVQRLSDTEVIVAERYCHGLTDKEIAESLEKPVWTIRTHKKHIYKKLSIASTHELVLYMVSVFVGKKWDASEVRRKGLAALLTLLMLFHIAVVEKKEVFRRGRRIEIELRETRSEDGEC